MTARFRFIPTGFKYTYIAIFLLGTSQILAKPPPDPVREGDDRPSLKDQKRIAELTDRHDPAGVEKLLADRPTMYQVYVARAFAKAGLEAKDPADRERNCKKAVAVYAQVLRLASDPKWFNGESRRLDVARWHVELADLILRFRALPDLDRFEITSGLEFDRERLETNLREALTQFARARGLLDELSVTMRTNEERIMLLGISDEIDNVTRQRDLGAAWTSIYLASILEKKRGERARLLGDAVTAFDGVSAAAKDPAMKYNALIGTAVALRESGRYDEALSALERVLASMAPAASVTRARYEKARCLIASGQYEAGRKVLQTVVGGHAGKDENADFYVRIAPVIRAYSFIMQAQARGASTPEGQRLMVQGREALQTLGLRGEAWQEIAGVYLRSLGDQNHNPNQMTDTELRMEARRAMGEQRFGDALALLDRLKSKTGANSDDAFDRAVCLAQTGRTREAADAFVALADSGSKPIAERAAEYAYRCRRDLAAKSKNRADYVDLAKSAELLMDRHSGNSLAKEARWVAALAREEAGELDAAIKAYELVELASPHYWNARRNRAHCMLLVFGRLPKSAGSGDRQRAARAAVDSLLEFANDLDGASHSTSRPSAPSGTQNWSQDARYQAAELLARDDIRQFGQSLEILDSLPAQPNMLLLKLTCLRGTGDLARASTTVSDLLHTGDEKEVAAAVRPLVADMSADIAKLRKAGKTSESQKAAVAGVSILEQVLRWAEESASRRELAVLARQSLAQLLRQAGRLNESADQLDRLMADEPTNGRFLFEAAQIQEEIFAAHQNKGTGDRAEALWGRLLEDPSLRESAQPVYWEARYRWLQHQLRHGRAAEVTKAVEAERAWFPELGGPPWQGLLIELSEKARSSAPQPGS